MKTTGKILAMATLLFLSGGANAQLGLLDAVKDSKKDKEAKKQQEQALAQETERKRNEEETKVKVRALKEKGDADKKANNYEAALASYEECAKLNETISNPEFKTYELNWAVDGMKRQVDHLSKMNAAYNAKDWNDFIKLATDTQYGFGKQNTTGSGFVWRDDIPADIKTKVQVAEEEVKWTCSYYNPTPAYTNEFHKRNIGKILFSKQEIRSDDTNPALADKFTLKDDIYGHFYLENDLRNECFSIGVCDPGTAFWYTHLRITVDGNSFDVDGNDYNQESLKSEFGAIFAADVRSKGQNLSADDDKRYQWLWEFFYYMPAGTHKIKIEKIFDIPEGGKGNTPRYQDKFGKERVLATGEFTLTVDAADKLAFSNKMCSPLERTGKVDAAVAARFKKEAGPGALKVWIKSEDWYYERNVSGVVTERRIFGRAISKDAKTGKYVLLSLDLQQEAVGTGFSDGICVVKTEHHIPAEWIK